MTQNKYTTNNESTLAAVSNADGETPVYLYADPTTHALTNIALLTKSDGTTVPQGASASGATLVGNARTKFRDGFANTDVVIPNPATWDTTNTNSDHIIDAGGNSFGSSYLRISLNPFVESSEVTLTSLQTFSLPSRFGFGLSTSQRIIGQEVFVGLVGVNAADAVETVTATPDQAITGATISITTNVGTVTLTNHGYVGGDRIAIFGCSERRLNVGPVVVTVVDKNNFTVPITLANGTYSTTGGMVRYADPFRSAKNGIGYLFENATTTNASFVSRRNGEKYRILNSTVASTTATQSSTSPYTDAFNSTAVNELFCSIDEMYYRSYAADSVAGPSGANKFSQGIPDEEKEYKIQIRARNLSGFTKPVAQVLTITKTGTTTATVVTDAAHGLATNDWVQIYGVRDQTNFPNLTASTVVGSVIDTTTFTVIIGSASSTASVDGTVFKNEGSVLAPGVYAQVVQSLSVTNGVLTLVGSGTWATPLPGEYVQVHGLTAAASAYEGAYKVLRVNTTSLELETTAADVGSITTGGTVFKRTDVRLHFMRDLDFTRNYVEVVGGRGNTTDINNAVPVTIAGSAAISVNATQTTGVSSTIWAAAGWGGFLVNDIVSAAITSTATTAAVSPGSVVNVGTNAHSFSVIVTAVSGTTPTMDVSVEESSDNGTNWNRIYDFPRIIATGQYVSPRIPATWGTRYRYVRTIGGSSPSFTTALNRMQFSAPAPFVKQFVDRSITLTSISSVSPTYTVDGAKDLLIGIKVGAITTTAPVIQLQGNEDGTSTGWYDLGTPLTAVASSYVASNVLNVPVKQVRAIIKTAGVGVTADYITVKAMGY